MYNRTDICMKCGSIVEDSKAAKELHDKFHQEHEELIEWAQAMSRAIVPLVPPNLKTDMFNQPSTFPIDKEGE